MEYTIIVDDREQLPIFAPDGYKCLSKRLNVGDYSLLGFEEKLSIERKSPSDLFQTLTGGHKRFREELKRAESLDYFAIVVETSYRNIRDKKFDGAYFSKVKGYIIMKILFTIHLKYKVPIFFANDRKEARSIIKSIFNSYLSLSNNKK